MRHRIIPLAAALSVVALLAGCAGTYGQHGYGHDGHGLRFGGHHGPSLHFGRHDLDRDRGIHYGPFHRRGFHHRFHHGSRHYRH